MKKLLIITLLLLLLLTSTVTFSQTYGIDLGFGFDPAMTFFKDKNGNKPLTIDDIFLVSLNGKKHVNDKWYFALDLEYEYAKLAGGEYSKWLISPKWVNVEYETPRIFGIKPIDIEAGIAIGGGRILRWKDGWWAGAITGEINLVIGKVKPFIRYQVMTAGDLDYQADGTPFKHFRKSGYMGVKYNFN